MKSTLSTSHAAPNAAELGNALIAFCVTHNLTVSPVGPGTEPGSCTALAVGKVDGPRHGWGLQLTAKVGAYGDGIEMSAVAMMRFGAESWHRMRQPDVFTWTTSMVPRDLPSEIAPGFLQAVAETYEAAHLRWKATISAHEAANSLALELGANGDRELSGLGYSGMVLASSPAPTVSLSIGAVSAEKARAILDILNAD